MPNSQGGLPGVPGPVVSWKVAEATPGITNPTIAAGKRTLYVWGEVQWTNIEFNTHEIDHETSTDWAHKEIAGAPIYREWVGENDELVYIRGMVFPYRIRGLSMLEMFEAKRRQGIADMIVRGDGRPMGWFVCEKLIRQHHFLSTEGVGQQITFEAIFARVPVPVSDQYFSNVWRVSGAGG